MKSWHIKQLSILALHGLVGWALCGLTMGIGMAITSEGGALIIHAAAAPIYFALIAWIYQTRFGYTRPWQTAVAFLAIVVCLDLFVVAALVLRSFEMFGSFLGTWLPFGLIFFSTWLVAEVAQAIGAARDWA